MNKKEYTTEEALELIKNGKKLKKVGKESYIYFIDGKIIMKYKNHVGMKDEDEIIKLYQDDKWELM